jgi:DNA topoisomerase-1
MTWIERLHRGGIVRRGNARMGFRYRHVGGASPSHGDLVRIRRLRLPPAWREVAIAPSSTARVQAVGRDAAGRWQYVYHPSHVHRREQSKQQRLLRFGAALPQLRRAIARDARATGLGREKVLAILVRILACAFIRPGSEAYAAENGSYGIATLRRKHVTVRGDHIIFDFPGKGGKRQRRALRDRIAARLIRQLLRLPGYEVFKYVADDGTVVDVRRADINAYIKRHMGRGFSAKDFRTWSGTLICACALARCAATVDERMPARKRAIVAALKETAAQLGNTPAICRSAYVSPRVLQAFERGEVISQHVATVERLLTRSRGGLHAAERAVLRLLARAERRPALPLRQAA